MVPVSTISARNSMPGFPGRLPERLYADVHQSESSRPQRGRDVAQAKLELGVEINLDTQWVHAIAPCANIVLVEAA